MTGRARGSALVAAMFLLAAGVFLIRDVASAVSPDSWCTDRAGVVVLKSTDVVAVAGFDVASAHEYCITPDGRVVDAR